MSVWTPNRVSLLRIHFSCIFYTYSGLHGEQSQVKQLQRASATTQASIQMLHLCHFLSNIPPACLVALTSTSSFDYTSPSYASIACWVGLQPVNNLTSAKGTHASFPVRIQFSSCPQQLWLQNPRTVPVSLPIYPLKTHWTDSTPLVHTAHFRHWNYASILVAGSYRGIVPHPGIRTCSLHSVAIEINKNTLVVSMAAHQAAFIYLLL